MVTDIIKERSPLVEKASIDEHYIDITGMDRFIKDSMLWAHELRHFIIKESGLPISFGLSVNKTVSKVATGEAKPSGEKRVDAGIEKLFLAPLSIHKIPGIGGKTFTALRNMGIERVGTIQQMPLLLMQRVLGENGQMIWKKANGIDNSPVQPYSEQKSMSSETTFDKDTTDIEQLKRVLIRMVEKLAFELRKSKKMTGCVTLKLRYSDFQTHTFQSRIAYTASDHVLLNKVLELFKKNYSRRVLIRLIGIRFSSLVSGYTQINLYEDTEEMINLYQSIDRIRMRYGFKAIMKSINLKTPHHDT
jgi:DNA polymerase-4